MGRIQKNSLELEAVESKNKKPGARVVLGKTTVSQARLGKSKQTGVVGGRA